MTDELSGPIEVTQLTPPVLRWIIGIFGAFIGLVATYELWRAVWPITIVTPFFGLMLGVGVYMGGTLVIAAIFGPDEVWRIEPGGLTIRRSLRTVHWQEHYRPGQFVSVAIRTVDWDSGPDTYRLDVKLASGQLLSSPQFGTENRARAAKALLEATP